MLNVSDTIQYVSVWVTLNSNDSQQVGHFSMLMTPNCSLCIVSCILFGGDKLYHKLVILYLFEKITTWHWSTNRYASFEIERKQFLNSRQRTETQNSKHWRNGFPDSVGHAVSIFTGVQCHRKCLFGFTWLTKPLLIALRVGNSAGHAVLV